ncbi:Uncharacterized protein FKW44_008564 [Caligus rogercresseyi]|uniref:Histone-lysine N-methyltransferase SETMAR n=1 Tax=Caligus rogercresseyi TaxID=217165 RepID=A0A7T8KGL3_CALRO|nr:Uncharacterized protein FKW44_008564 [Caligus rogercresseyi]
METPDFCSYFLIWIKLARTVNEIHGDLLSTFPDSCPGEEDPTEENVARVKRLVEDNPRMTTRQVAAEASDGGSRALKPSQLLVPHQLCKANKTQRVNCSGPWGGLSGVSPVSPGRVLVLLGFVGAEASLGGANGGPVLDPPCETDSEGDDDSDGVHLQAGAGIDHCTTCRDHNRPEHHDRRFLSLKKDKIRQKDCLLMWDNARPHTATDNREFLTRRDVEPVKQSPSSPVLNLSDRFLFRKLKHLLQEDEFGGHEEATLAVQRGMRKVSVDELYGQIRKLWGHCTTSLQSEGIMCTD